MESALYSSKKIPDELLEELLSLTTNRNLTKLQKEKIGFLLARYIMDEDNDFKRNKVNHEGQTFAKSITSKPWALNLRYKKGQIKRHKKSLRERTKKDEEESKREPGSLIAEMYANKANDWIVSTNLHLISIPDLSLIGKGRIVGREEEGKGWIFKNDDIDQLKKRKKYLAIFEYDNSDSEKSIQGVIFEK
jgi:hypothetical protein